MASPVDTSVKHITSTMVGSPVINGVAGSLVGLLDAFLVDGWGLQTATSLVVSGGVATLTFPSAFPATVDSVILVAGATPSDLNGEQRVTQVLTATNQVRFATALPDGTATGTITVKMAPAGWAKVFSGTNKAVYRSLDPQAHGGGYFLRVDDSSATLPRVVAYEQMFDVDTGIGAFPTNAQQANGGLWPRTATSGAAAVRAYALFADTRTLYLVNAPQTIGAFTVRGFGDGTPKSPYGDAYASFLSVAPSTGDGNSANTLDAYGSQPWAYAPRAFSGLGTALQLTPRSYVAGNSSFSGADSHLGTCPSTVDGTLFLSRKFAADSSGGSPRFDFPGMYTVPQSGIASTFETFSKAPGSGEATGRTLMVMLTAGSNATSAPAGGCFFDITGPWR